MIVDVEHLLGSAHCVDEASLRATLALRDDSGSNEFWISGAARNPCLTFVVRGDIAGLHCFPADGHPGFVSRGPGDADEMIDFASSSPPLALTGNAIVPASVALEAAIEFARTLSLPSSVTWFEL